jgi:hypothetical protein
MTEGDVTDPINKHFFSVDDGGARYCLVARDLEHAKQLLRDAGVEFTADDGDSYPIDAPEVADVEWREITSQDAARRRVLLGLDGADPQSVLAACEIGDWFTSEF